MKKIIIVLLSLVLLSKLSTAQFANNDSLVKYHDLATAFLLNEKYDSSNIYFKKVAFIAQSINDNRLFANALDSIAINYYYKGKYDSGISFFDSSLVILRKYYPEDSLSMANIFTSMSACYIMSGIYPPALEYTQKSIEIIKGIYGPNELKLIEPLETQGVYYSRVGNFEHQMKNYKEALRILQLYPGDSNLENLSTAYNNIGESFGKFGEVDSQLHYLLTAINIAESAPHLNQSNLATHYNNIANCYYAKGDIDKSLLYITKALKIRESLFGENHPLVAESYNNLSMSYEKDPKMGLFYAKKSLEIYKKVYPENHPDMGMIYHNVGFEYGQFKNYDLQTAYFKKSLQIYKNVYGEDNFDVAQGYRYLGYAYEKSGNIDSAILSTQKALQIEKKYLPPKHTELALALNQLAGYYRQKKKFKTALYYVQSSLIAISRGYDDTSYESNPQINNAISKAQLADILYEKAGIFDAIYEDSIRDTKYLIYALKTLNVAIPLFDSMSVNYTSESSKNFLSGDFYNVFRSGGGIAFDLYKKTGSVEYLDQSFLFSERNKAFSLLDAIRDARAQKLAHIPDSLLNKEKRLTIRLGFYKRMLANNRLDSATKKSYRDEYLIEKSQYEDLLTEMQLHYKEYYQYKHVNNIVNLTQVKDRLKPDEAIIDYVITQHGGIAVYLLTKDFCNVYTVPVKKNILHLVNEYLYSLNSEASEPTIISKSNTLYNILIKPLEKGIVGKKNLIVIPDGILNYLPFETLVAHPYSKGTTFQNASYLVNKFSISYHYSATLLLNTDVKKVHHSSFMGVAPVFESKMKNGQILENKTTPLNRSYKNHLSKIIVNGKTLTPLPYTKDEITSIAHLFESQGLLFKEFLYSDAREDSFKKNVGKYKYVQIATHGMVNDEEPQFSGVFFSQTNQSDSSVNPDQDDEILYSGEMYNLNLDSTDLIVLSACETGLGKLIQGEGMMSMVRGILYSGCPNVIFSLWRVNDRPTKELMVYLYKNILAGKKYAEALREAKLEMLKNKLTAAPKNWGGFALIGALH